MWILEDVLRRQVPRWPPDVAETLTESQRVPDPVGAVVGASHSPSLGANAAVGPGRVVGRLEGSGAAGRS